MLLIQYNNNGVLNFTQEITMVIKKKKKKKPVPEHGLKFYLREDSSPNKQIPF